MLKILNGMEYLQPENQLVVSLKRTLRDFPDCVEGFEDALSIGQLKSKQWLIDNLPHWPDMGIVHIHAGWYGTLAFMMFEQCSEKFQAIRSFDIDPSCASVADSFNHKHVIDGWRFKATTMDIHDAEYPGWYTTKRSNGSSVKLKENPDTIINTSCEHIENFDQWYAKIPKGRLVVLQSNDYFSHPQHVNCVKNTLHFAEMAPLHKEYFIGELKLDKYTRFMRIGIK